MTREENIRAILECNFTGFKDEIIDSACERICEEPYICDSCKNKENGWDTEPCDGCCGNHNGYEPTDAISRDAVWGIIMRSDFVDRFTYQEFTKKLDALPNVPVTPQKPCEDAISRQAVLNGLASIAKAKAKSDAQKSLMGRVMFFTEQLPPVNPRPKTGHWIEHPEIKTSTPEYLMFYECSECGDKQCFCKSDIQKKHFCNNCGAKMESEIHCNCTDAEIAKSFIEDVEAVKDLLPQAEGSDKE